MESCYLRAGCRGDSKRELQGTRQMGSIVDADDHRSALAVGFSLVTTTGP